MQTFIFCSDLHGDNQHHKTVDALFKFTDIYKPNKRIFGGDLFDFRQIRRGVGGAEKQESMLADVGAGLEFLTSWNPDVFLLGNHDQRLWDTAAWHKDGLVRDTAERGVSDIQKKCKKLGCKIIPYRSDRGYYDLGRVRMIHGYATGIYASKKMAEIYSPASGIVLHGHTHAIQNHSVPRIGGGRGMGVGCMARLDPEYNRHQTGRLIHAHGWAYGFVDGSDWECFQAKKTTRGQWVVAVNLTTI